MKKHFMAGLIATLFMSTAWSSFPLPDPEPRVTMIDAIAKAEAYAKRVEWTDDAYPSKVALVRNSDDYSWLVWLASPTKAFLILEVRMDEDVTLADRERIQAFFPTAADRRPTKRKDP